VKHEENDTYVLIPNEVNEEFWSVRILKGMFNETVIRYGNIAFNEAAEGVMSFNFFVEYSPDSTVDEDNVLLQEVAGDILQKIIANALDNNEGIVGKKPEDDEWEEVSAET
tara:strand:+ start:1941 stop:2273 length:333 start_codon:yes stop_codon:yes gene_type:complete